MKTFVVPRSDWIESRKTVLARAVFGQFHNEEKVGAAELLDWLDELRGMIALGAESCAAGEIADESRAANRIADDPMFTVTTKAGKVLKALGDGSRYIKDIHEKAGVSHSFAFARLKIFHKLGLVDIEVEQKLVDRRSARNIYVLTTRGRALVETADS